MWFGGVCSCIVDGLILMVVSSFSFWLILGQWDLAILAIYYDTHKL
jgi:hypothetical protein